MDIIHWGWSLGLLLLQSLCGGAKSARRRHFEYHLSPKATPLSDVNDYCSERGSFPADVSLDPMVAIPLLVSEPDDREFFVRYESLDGGAYLGKLVFDESRSHFDIILALPREEKRVLCQKPLPEPQSGKRKRNWTHRVTNLLRQVHQ